MLSRIEFENFRGFRKLTLDGLQRVNLVVGKNNSGKTSLLEGIAALLNCIDAPQHFSKLRQIEQGLQQYFQQGRYGDWVIRDEAAEMFGHLSGIWAGSIRQVFLVPVESQPGMVYPQAEKPQSGAGSRQQMRHPDDPKIKTCIVPGQSNRPESLVQSLGNAIRRRDGEELLESALHSVDPRIKKVRIVPSGGPVIGGFGGNITQVEVDIGLSRLVPISQVGQGTYRLIEMFSEIIGTDSRVAFIDEVENGIHHTCLIDVWSGIAEAAERFNVQLFVTTHSHECIEAAHSAFSSRACYDFGIIQLFRESGEIQGRVLNQEHIAAAIAGDIDLRA